METTLAPITPLVFATKLPVIVMADANSADTTVGDTEISAAHFNDIDRNANTGANASKQHFLDLHRIGDDLEPRTD